MTRAGRAGPPQKTAAGTFRIRTGHHLPQEKHGTGSPSRLEELESRQMDAGAAVDLSGRPHTLSRSVRSRFDMRKIPRVVAIASRVVVCRITIDVCKPEHHPPVDYTVKVQIHELMRIQPAVRTQVGWRLKSARGSGKSVARGKRGQPIGRDRLAICRWRQVGSGGRTCCATDHAEERKRSWPTAGASEVTRTDNRDVRSSATSFTSVTLRHALVRRCNTPLASSCQRMKATCIIRW